MTPKATSHVIQGMQKDTSKSKLSKEFAFDAKNIRITAREDNSLLTVTNEKGNKLTKPLFGSYLGHCVLNNQLIIFTTTVLNKDFIFLYDSDFNQTKLYSGILNFSLDNPIEALGVYENEEIQKVYWVDGINQPRVINIKASEEVRSKWSDTSFDFIPELALQESVSIEAISNTSMFAPGVIQYAFSYYNKYGQESNIFYTTPLCYLSHNNRGANPEEIITTRAFKLNVSNIDTSFEYIRIYSIHRTSINSIPTVKRVVDLPIIIPEKYTNISETAKIYNLGFKDKLYFRRIKEVLPPGALDYDNKLVTECLYAEDPTISTNGNIEEKTTIYNLASISNDLYDLVIGEYSGGKLIIEKTISGKINSFKYKKVETTIRGESLINYTIESTIEDNPIIINYTKENNQIPSITYIDNGTLGETIDPNQLLYIGGEDIIAGTITQKDNTLFLGNIKLNNIAIPEEIKTLIKNNYEELKTGYRYLEENKQDELYKNNNISINNSYFRSGEYYRLGIQFQYKNGKWSEPVYIGDKIQSVNKPTLLVDGTIKLPSFTYNIKEDTREYLSSKGFKKMRGVVVLPETHERLVIAQGILCPTLFRTKDREKNNPYSQSSWLLRPNLPYNIENFDFNNDDDKINLGASAEFRHGRSTISGGNMGSEIQGNLYYNIDQSTLTFHSPDIEFESNDNNFYNNINLRIVGLVNFTSNYGDINIQTSSTYKYGGGFQYNKYINTENGGTSTISGLFYKDTVEGTNPRIFGNFLTYLWHRSGSLNWDNSSIAATKSREQYAKLKTKKISNIKFSTHNTWLDDDNIWEAIGGNSKDSTANGISSVSLFDSDQVSLCKITNSNKEVLNYYGNVDTLLTSTEYPIYYKAANVADPELFPITEMGKEYYSTDPIRIKYKSSPHLVFSLNPTSTGNINILPTTKDSNGDPINSLNDIIIGDIGSSTTDVIIVKYKYIGNIEDFTGDFKEGDLCIEYYNRKTYKYSLYVRENNEWKFIDDESKQQTKYGYYVDNMVEIYNYHISDYSRSNYYNLTFLRKENVNTGDSSFKSYKQDALSITAEYPYLYIAELYREKEYIENIFGGITEEAIKNNLWLPASQSVPINTETITYEYGDTRYQRYDCLKTYAFTPEDENQVIEIASFMCETRVNMLGRYDKNIGNLSNLNADPTNFNLFNPVYSQKDNFFNYRILDSDLYKLDKFNNTITWSKKKFYGEQVDTWTNITMASTLDLDGTKGKVNKLITFKDQIFAFQDKGISNILFNSRVQIPVSDGVPVEISNGMKVDGSRYISDNIGCQNKNSIITTPLGVYFLDSESNGIYLLADGLTNLSTNKGFDIWTKEVSKDSSFKSFYDKNEKDVYFTTKDYCLGYSEKLGQFTSFYDYNDVETMFNIGTGFYSIKADSVGNQSIYQHSIGNYNEFYGEIKPYHLTIISNEDPQVNKVFTNLDYRADFFDSNNNYLENESFDTLEVWNEYQRGKETLKYSKFRPSNLKKKFRMWGVNIPRDKKNKLDRMRNPWLYIKLSKEKPGTSKMELHDLVVKYLE